VEDLIRDKHLLIVPSGALTQLPFQVLVTAAPASSGDYRSAAWLARRHAIAVLPAVSSLKALRRVAKASAATKPMIGFAIRCSMVILRRGRGRPSGPLARQSRPVRRRRGNRWPQVERRRGVVPMATRGGRPDLDHLKVQTPLHDTADELCAVAKDLKLASDDIVLGANATEATIKKLSDQGKLAQYRVLHFATHGTLAGEIEGTHEPGLIFTPPKEQSDLDDGYLSASEVAALKLDADWVILSACNTAAGGAKGAGLCRAWHVPFMRGPARCWCRIGRSILPDRTAVRIVVGATRATRHFAAPKLCVVPCWR
jgi:CHAT domain-containing protein